MNIVYMYVYDFHETYVFNTHYTDFIITIAIMYYTGFRVSIRHQYQAPLSGHKNISHQYQAPILGSPVLLFVAV